MKFNKKYVELKVINNEKKMFCTECGTDLDDFDVNPESNDIEAVKKNHENCKEIGKFKGNVCSKIFIAENNTDEIINLDSEEDDD